MWCAGEVVSDSSAHPKQGYRGTGGAHAELAGSLQVCARARRGRREWEEVALQVNAFVTRGLCAHAGARISAPACSGKGGRAATSAPAPPEDHRCAARSDVLLNCCHGAVGGTGERQSGRRTVANMLARKREHGLRGDLARGDRAGAERPMSKTAARSAKVAAFVGGKRAFIFFRR